MKKTILHVIYSLGRGGAETMLVKYLSALQEYNNIVVTLKDDHHFEEELVCERYICLHQPSLFSIPFAALKLRSVIKKYKVNLVHSHLPVSNFVARLATPKHIPLVTTIHNSIATSKDYKRRFIRLLDSSTYKMRESTIIAVSQGAMNDYFSVLNIKPGKTVLLHNFVDIEKYGQAKSPGQAGANFKVICVGALSVQKNMAFLIKAFAALKHEKVELHIYGRGELQNELQQLIKQLGAPVKLKGQVKNIHEVLPAYDLYTMSSLFEGSSLSVMEAMAVQLPLLLSDIPSFREQCEETAIYFNLNNVQDYVAKLQMMKADKSKLETMGLAGRQRVVKNFTFTDHMAQLKNIYINSFNNPGN